MLAQTLQLGFLQIAISMSVNALIAVMAGSMPCSSAARPGWVAMQRWLMAAVFGGLAVRMATEARRAA